MITIRIFIKTKITIMGPPGPIWSHLVPPGPTWSHLVPPGVGTRQPRDRDQHNYLYFLVPRSTVYRDVLANADYTLTSPNYPSNYPNDKTLYWALSASAGERIQLSFNFFRLSLDDTLSVSLTVML